MTDKQIIINDYFNIMRDENGRIFCIQEIGDPKSLIKARKLSIISPGFSKSRTKKKRVFNIVAIMTIL